MSPSSLGRFSCAARQTKVDVATEQCRECSLELEVSVEQTMSRGRFELDEEIDVALCRTEVMATGCGAELL
jgi:hypothetical protein